MPGNGSLWLVGPFNGLLDSPFLLCAENNPGECSKLITFGPGLAATFQYEPPCKGATRRSSGVRQAQNGRPREERGNFLVLLLVKRGTRLSFCILTQLLLVPAGSPAALVIVEFWGLCKFCACFLVCVKT